MISNVPGNAVFETTAGSAAARPPAEPQPVAAGDKTSAAHDAQPQPRHAQPVTANAGGERATDDAPRGRAVDIKI